MLHIQAILTVSLILFSVIDIIGSLPLVIDLKKQGLHFHSVGTTAVAGGLMLLFLFFGTGLLGAFGLDVASFALAGSLIIFFMGLEMVLGIRFFRADPHGGSGTVVPLAFPLIAGAGTLTTILSLRADYAVWDILIAIVLNLIIVFGVLRSSDWLARKIGPQTAGALRKIFGVLLIAIAIQMIRSNWG